MSRKVGFETAKGTPKKSENHLEELKGILDKGERILWQGAPVKGVNFALDNSHAGFIAGLFFIGFAVFWINAAFLDGDILWMAGLIPLAIGVYYTIGCHFWKAILRGRTFYTLTNKRAFVAQSFPLKGRTLKSYPILENTVLEYDGAEPATITFHYEELRDSDGDLFKVPVRFEKVKNGQEIMEHFRVAQLVEKGSVA